MKGMTGWWGWRGSRGSQAGDPGPVSQAHTAPQEEDAGLVPGAADAGTAHGGGAVHGAAHGGGAGTGLAPGGAEDGAAEAGARRPVHRDGADEASNGVSAQRRGAPAGRLPHEQAVPRALQRAADWSWRLLLVGLLI
jgi:hypothetical protein